MKIDVLASESQFMDHLVPIWRALPLDLRGEFIVPSYLSEHAHRHRLPRRRRSHASDAVLVASWGDHKRARALNYRHLARIEHGIGQSFGTDHPSYAGGAGCEDVGLWLVPNQHCGDRWQAAYPDARVRVVGCPKLDRLPDFIPTSPPTVAVSFHWNGTAAPEAAGGFADFQAAVLALRDRPDINVVMHSHPKTAPEIRRWAQRHRLGFLSTFDEVLEFASLYVCDGVSTLYEFAYTGRPVVVLNAVGYRPHVNHGLRFWDAADVGVQVNPGDSLSDAIDEAFVDPPVRRANRDAALRMVYAHRGDATHRAVRALTAWARQLSEQPMEVVA